MGATLGTELHPSPVPVAVSTPTAPPEPSARIRPAGTVIDLFCGIGGLSHGFLLEGFAIACGYDTDEDCRYPFEENNRAPFVRRDVAEIDAAELARNFSPQAPRILVGCAPCQPFSSYSRGLGRPKWSLLTDFARIAVETRPDIVTMENVPQLVRFDRGRGFQRFVGTLEEHGYQVRWDVLNCLDFGIPQARSRLVLIGSRHGEPSLPEPTHRPNDYVSVKQVIGHLPPLEAGQADVRDPIHRASIMSDLNLKRIQASRPGGTWRDWQPELVAACHRKATGRQYFAVYGRMAWNRPSPTITTQFHGFGNGRFGHPEQDRALSLREGALLQTFPSEYAFTQPGQPIRITVIGRMIGNAVPVTLGRAVARAVKLHLQGRRL